MIRKESFKRIKVMLMFKLALSLIRKCAGTAFPNDEGFFLFLFSSLEKSAFVLCEITILSFM